MLNLKTIFDIKINNYFLKYILKLKGANYMKNKVFSLFILMMFICILSSCSVYKYHAKIYNQAKEWISEEFLKENRVRAYYVDENYVEGVSDPWTEVIFEPNKPSERTFIIKEQDEFTKIFTKYVEEYVDFEKEMVILYIFSDVYIRDYHLKKIIYENQTLTIHIKLQHINSKIDDAVQLYQRCLMIKMDKLEIDSVSIIEDK